MGSLVERGHALAGRAEAFARRLPGAGIVEVALEHDRTTAAGLLAGGLAYRLFFWLVPFGLVVASALSFWYQESPDGLEDAAREFGLGAVAVKSASAAIQEGTHARWYLLLFGTVLLFWFGIGVVRALRVACTIAWRLRPERLERAVRAGLIFTAGVTVLLALGVLAQVLHEQMPGPGIAVTLGLIVAYFAAALLTFLWMPHADAPWTALVPGAVLIAAGLEAIHVVVALYLAPRLGRSSELYGALGSSTVILVWLYLTARLVVAGAFLNAARWYERQSSTNESPGSSTRTST